MPCEELTCKLDQIIFSPNLTWRDLQHIIANTAIYDPNIARDTSFEDKHKWKVNGSGYHGECCLEACSDRKIK